MRSWGVFASKTAGVSPFGLRKVHAVHALDGWFSAVAGKRGRRVPRFSVGAWAAWREVRGWRGRRVAGAGNDWLGFVVSQVAKGGRGNRYHVPLFPSCRRGELVPETVVPLVLFRWRRSRCICAVPRGHRAAGPTARHNLVHIQIRVPSLAARNVRRPIGVLNYVFDTPIRNAFARRGIFGRYKTQTGCEIVQIFLLLGLERRSLLAFGGHSSQSTKVDSFEVDQELVLALDVDILAGKRICIETVSRGIRVYCDLFDTRRVDLNV